MPAINILIFEEILKNPRETLRIESNYCKRNNSTLDEIMEYSIQSSGTQSIEKTIQIHELKTKYEKKYSLWLQNGSCRFGKDVKSFMRLIRITKRKVRKKRKKLTMIKKEIRRNFRKNILLRIILITRLLELQDTVH